MGMRKYRVPGTLLGSPWRMHSKMIVRPVHLLICALWGISALLLIASYGCPHKPTDITVSISRLSSMQPQYVGNHTCVRCHPKECRTYAGTRHATTMYSANSKSLGKLAP